MAVVIPQTGSVIISRKKAWETYGVHESEFRSFLGLLHLKKDTFEKISTKLEIRADIRNAVAEEIKRVMGLDAKGRASGAVAERFCQMNGLDIKKAAFFMVNHVPTNENETIAFSVRHDGKILDIAVAVIGLVGYGEDYVILYLSKDNEGHFFSKRFGKPEGDGIIEGGRLKPEIKSSLTQVIGGGLEKGFVATHNLFAHKRLESGVFAIQRTLYP